ncbi:hypothetical protein Tco_0479698, partial [Tanacetum coccineum]
MARAQRDEFLVEKDKSHKRRKILLLLLYQIRISVRGDDMTLAHLVHHSLKLLSHQHGRSLTLEMLLQAPPSNNLVLILSNQSKKYQYLILPIYLIQRTLTLP